MPKYTYFVMTPGADRRSYVRYNDGLEGNYVKFGDSDHDHDALGIRDAYRTHNPDIGVAAVMESTAIAGPLLGTRLKHVMLNAGYGPVQGTAEWFALPRATAHLLFATMSQWDRRTIAGNNLGALVAAVQGAI